MFEDVQSCLLRREIGFPAPLLEAVALLSRRTESEAQAAVQTYLGEVYYWLGEYATAVADKERYHQAGVAAGKKAVQLLPEAVEAHLWYAANMGSHGMARGIMSSLFYIGDIEKHGLRAQALDETYFHGAPLRLLGRFYHQCPGWPIGKGDPGKAIELLERAVVLGPNFILNHLYLADVYLTRRKKEQARALLKHITAIESFDVFPVYQSIVRSEAEKLLARL